MQTDATVTRTFDLTGPINLDCRVAFGSLTVHAVDNVAQAVATITTQTPESDIATRTVVEMRGRTLTVRTPKPHGIMFDFPSWPGGLREHDGVDVDITVPSGTAVKASTYGADITLLGRSGGADIAAGTTSIELDHVDGDLRMRYGRGPARVHRVTGSAAIKAGSGDITMREVGQLAMGCGTGDIAVDVAHGRVHLRAGTGQVRVGLVEDDVDVVVGAGTLAVGLRRGQVARLDVTTGAGRLDSDLSVEETAPASGRAITIRARTGCGDVRLFRAEEPGSAGAAA
jgi:hypothetical protein